MRAIKLILFFCLCSCFSVKTSVGQSNLAYEYLERAIVSMHTDERQKAIRYANMAIFENPELTTAYILLSDIYNIIGDKEMVNTSLEKAFEIDSMHSPNISLNLAIYSYENGKYSDAKRYIDFFYKYGDYKTARNIDIPRLKECIEFSFNAINNPVPFEPINLGDAVNSQYNDYWPALSANGRILTFTRLVPSSRLGRNATRTDFLDNPDLNCRNCPLSSMAIKEGMNEDIFISYKIDNDWSEAVPISTEVNTQYNEGAQCISADGKTIIFSACNRPGNIGECDLYILFNRDGKWTKPQNMKTVNSRYWDSNPSLSFDGKTLYFASKRPGGIGGKDIWKINIDEFGNATSPAINLGKPVNTEYDEVSPFIHHSNRNLYFASNGHIGLGDYDLFYSVLDSSGQWGFPVNMGYPINTHNEERSLIVNAQGDIAMFASSRENGRGLDIYSFSLDEIIEPVSVIGTKAYVKDYYSEKGLRADIEIVSLFDNKAYYTLTSDHETGEFLIPFSEGGDFAVNVSLPGYLFHSEIISLSEKNKLSNIDELVIYMHEIQEGAIVILKNIFFDFDSYELLPESYSELKNILRFMNDNPQVSIEIGGHTDNSGSKEYNQNLSEQRAKTVYNYLIDNGVSDKRLSYHGYYFSEPISNNDTEEGRALNRRTEFKITSINK